MFVIGQTYSRADVQKAIGAPITSGGAWGTGYVEYAEQAWIFCNVGSAGRTGSDYNNHWDGDRLVWRGKNSTKRGQPQIERIISGDIPVHIFFRTRDRDPFVYAGVGHALNTYDQGPVNVVWELPNGRPNEPLTADEIAAGLEDLGFSLGPIGSKSQKATRNGIVLYLKRDTQLTPLVLAPKWQDQIAFITDIPGVWRNKDDYFYHQSMLQDFPSRKHTGKTQTHYGIDIDINSKKSLNELIDFLEEWLKRPVSPLPTSKANTFEAEEDGMDVDPKTETEAMRAARLGQARYRNELLALWKGRCALTGLAMPEAIRASHIKPWSKSTPKERLDPYNGLPLLVHIDHLFDRGLISFTETGEIILSPKLTNERQKIFGLAPGMKIENLPSTTQTYLIYHREMFGLN